MEVPPLDVGDKIGGIISETVCYTLAEIHVHGILAGLGFVLNRWLHEDAIAIVLTGIFAGLAFRHHRKVKKLQKPPAISKGNNAVWFTHNF